MRLVRPKTNFTFENFCNGSYDRQFEIHSHRVADVYQVLFPVYERIGDALFGHLKASHLSRCYPSSQPNLEV
jgi:hypothetical protein